MKHKTNIFILWNYIFVLLLIIGISLFLGKYQYKYQYDYESFDVEPKYTLTLIIICKNESMILNEFIEHYKWQGVEHIYFIDNNSTDNTRDILQKYIESEYLSYYYLPMKYKQMHYYNLVYNSIRKETKWIIVCDADEYIYNRTAGNTILSYINSIDYNSNINSIILPWKMFGSSDYVEHPISIRKSFIWKKKDTHENIKSIINTKYTYKLNVHDHKYEENTIVKNGTPELALNHYAIMSQEYFIKIKMTRGSANNSAATAQNMRNEKYYSEYDFKEEIDEELKNLVT